MKERSRKQNTGIQKPDIMGSKVRLKIMVFGILYSEF
jgi:hypothetical protein